MSDIQKGTIRERLARIEILLCNHLAHHSKIEKWMLMIGGLIIAGLAIQILPGLIKSAASCF